MLQAIQGRVERSLLDAQLVLRHLLDSEQHGIAMKRPERNGLENQEIEGAL